MTITGGRTERLVFKLTSSLFFTLIAVCASFSGAEGVHKTGAGQRSSLPAGCETLL